ncbi:MAG: NUDIX domain-containing protein [Longimicrobiales bacterium]
MLGGLWELPGDVAPASRSTRQTAVRAAGALLGEPPALAHRGAITRLTHTFSHFRARYDVYALTATTDALTPGATDAGWFDEAALREAALPVAQRRILSATLGPPGGPSAACPSRPRRVRSAPSAAARAVSAGTRPGRSG